MNNEKIKMVDLISIFTKIIIKNNSSYSYLDENYVFNRIVNIIGINKVYVHLYKNNVHYIVSELANAAIKNNKFYNKKSYEIIVSELMDLITPLPHEVNSIFWAKYKIDPKKATNYFYNLCIRNNYIHLDKIRMNKEFLVNTNIGKIEITINLSKPEKDPKNIALALNTKNSKYPKCNLCFSNEGYINHMNDQSHLNLRIIHFKINDKDWGFQYSPYCYFKEHAIFISKEHSPMLINKETYIDLLKIIEIFPFYFVGSNSDLPIVGGSILSHKHYQGGSHNFPIMESNILREFKTQYSDVQCGIVNWPVSTIRLISENINHLVEVAYSIQKFWDGYSNELLHIYSSICGVKHHSVTPIAYFKNNKYVIDILLRDNHVSKDYPDGEFHSHPEYHHIKKENIGLIEVMGRAILPGRLYQEMNDVENYLINDKKTFILKDHKKWADMLYEKYNCINKNNVKEIIKKELALVFVNILKNVGVFKQDKLGQRGFNDFMFSWQQYNNI